MSNYDEWQHAIQYIHEAERAVLEFAKTWADSWSVDYDEGPSGIEFQKNGASYWYLIDDIGWDADDPRSELIVALLAKLASYERVVEAARVLAAHRCIVDDANCVAGDHDDCGLGVKRRELTNAVDALDAKEPT